MATTYLSRTPSGAGNRKTFTISLWFKRSDITRRQALFNNTDGGGQNGVYYDLQADDTLLISDYGSGSFNWNLETTQVFRDVSAWYHLVISVDTTQSTASNRVKIYINGTQITNFDASNYPSQDSDTLWNRADTFEIGSYNGTGNYFEGSMSHIHFTDGTAYDASAFGETDATTGIWKPKTAPSVTYGTNGFFLKFENSAAFGTDSSGNSNTFSVNGTMTQTIDTPSNVFATMNALDATSQTLTNGNTSSFNIANRTSISTLGFSAGKYYWEVKNVTQNVYTMLVGITNETNVASGILSSNLGSNANGWSYFIQNNTDNGKAFNNNTSSSVYQTVSQGDIVSIAVDADAGKIWWGVNGTWVNSGDPANGTNAVFTNVPTSETLFPAFTAYNGSGGNPLISFNFGNGYFGTTAVSSAQNPDDGIGIFEYDVPAGYRALNTKSINAEEYN